MSLDDASSSYGLKPIAKGFLSCTESVKLIDWVFDRGFLSLMQSVKDSLIDVIQKLPSTTTYDDAIEAILVRARFEAGKAEIDQGKGVRHEDALKQFEKWLK